MMIDSYTVIGLVIFALIVGNIGGYYIGMTRERMKDWKRLRREAKRKKLE